jgi:hypothetical protein
MFHLTGVECKPPCPAADFSKANWGDHFGYDADGRMFSVIPTSVADDSSLRQAIKLKLKGIKRAHQDRQPSLMRRQVTCLQLKTIAEPSQPLYLYSR